MSDRHASTSERHGRDARAFLAVGPFYPSISARALIGLNVAVACAYAATGYAGLTLAFVGHTVTLFWPPSGIAFAAVWLGGFRLLPGVVAGAFAVNAAAFGVPSLAGLVALGNALPVLTATWALRRAIGRGEDGGELRRVALFILVAALACTTLSASVGTLAVALLGKTEESLQSTWVIWWLGDGMGVMIAAPPILLWRRVAAAAPRWGEAAEIAALAAAGFGVVAGLLTLVDPVWATELCKLCTLLLSLSAAARFGLNGPAWTTLLMALGIVAATALGDGPFVRGGFYDSFALVHSHLFVVSIAGMLLAAGLADLRAAAAREQRAREAAEAVAANRVRLLTMISHDVRTPLSGMLAVLQTLARSEPEPAQKRLIDLGLRSGETLTTLVSDILDVARTDSGRVALALAPFDPVRSLADIVELNRRAASAKALSLALELDGPLPPFVLGDRVRFEQIVSNLVANAVAYTARGGVAVRAGWAGDPCALTVAVSDTGPGVAPEALAGLFDAFAPTAPPSPRSSGLGFGLHICRRLADLMGGTVAYASPEGGGSRFDVALPLPAAEPGPPEPTAHPAAEPALRVLLVEDDEVAGETTCALLRSHGHTVTLAADAETAVACAAQTFDLVLLDIELQRGEVSGLDVARQIRANGAPGVPVTIVALTGISDEADAAEYAAAGIDRVMIKPLSMQESVSSFIRTEKPVPIALGV